MTRHDVSWIRELIKPLRVKPGSVVHLPADYDPGARFGLADPGLRGQ